MQTIPQTAKSILQCSGPIPEPLRNALSTVFLKPSNKLKKWQKNVLLNPDENNKTPRYLKAGLKPAVHNALTLCFLLEDSGKVRQLFNYILEGGSSPTEQLIKIIQQRAEMQFSEFFCLGIVRENLAPVIAQIQNKDWNPLTEALPSPFSTDDLTPLALIYAQKIPWAEYHQRYSAALVEYEAKRLDKAQSILDELEREAVIRLPVVTTLHRQIQARQQSAENYFEYLQKNL